MPASKRSPAIYATLRRHAGRRLHHLHRLSRKSLQLVLLLCGAALVSFVSLGFAHMVDFALNLNRTLVSGRPWFAFVLLPFGLALICWLTVRFSPFASGSGIPQVIASISMPWGPAPMRLVSFFHVVWKIPLTFLGMIIGASIGREGPSVQVGAGLMLAWGMFCRRIGMPLKGVHPSELIATGAAGGLAAAFNAPLAGVIFAIEELGRGTALRWQRAVLLGVLASGFFTVAVMGNNPYFGTFSGGALDHDMLLWTLSCALACGIGGGIFGRLLGKGIAAYSPSRYRGWLRRHPVAVAFLMGLLVACLGLFTHGGVYGTGYGLAADALAGGQPQQAGFSIAKIGATVASYWAGIPGGIFTPALTIGASIGSELGRLAGPSVDVSVLVLLSMAAFLAAATQAPITASVVVMEMTGSQPMLFWLLVGSLAASMVGKQFCPHPFYHHAAGRFRHRVSQSDRPADT
jgi:H+/Cl- antiporter ClcA